MNHLLDLETKLTIIANNPCVCMVCRHAAHLAKHALIEIAPSAAVLLELNRDTPEFRDAEQIFHKDEIARLQNAYDYVCRGRCELAPAPVLDTAPPPQATPEIPLLPDPEQYRERIEHYHKHKMKPRIVHRRPRVEKLKNPRVPGSYWIK